MEFMQGLEGLYIKEETAVTLGKFDGLHRGHQKLINRTKEFAADGYKSVVFTLDFDRKEMLLTKEERRKLLKEKEVDYLVECPFTPEVASMEPEEFVKMVLVEKLNAKRIVVGADFRFGHGRKGDVGVLRELGEHYGFLTEVFEKEQRKDRVVSSTFIREVLDKGDMETAGEFLGYDYFVSGEVLHGCHIGGRLLVPTVNLIPTTRKLLPPNGVYIARVHIGSRVFGGITNIGFKPTVGEKFRGVETYLFDFDEDLYGCDIEVELLHYLRPEKKFESIDALREQMQKDIAIGKAYFQGSVIEKEVDA